MLNIHKASAGSGKTYALTKEYLKLLLGQKRDGRFRLRPLSSYGYLKPKAHGEILAVTFTNKATEEMTNRIINELAALAGNGKKSPYQDDFIREFGTDEATLRQHAGRALSDLLYNFSWFNVSTIDSFFQRVLNTFTRELELPPNRNVEIDDKYPLSIAVEKMLTSINRVHGAESDADRGLRRYLEEWLRQYMMSMLAEGKSFNLLSQTSSVNAGLISDMGHFFNEKYKLNRTAIDSYLSDPARIVRFARAVAPDGALADERTRTMELCRRAADMADDTVLKLLVTRLRAYGDGDFSTAPSDTFRKCAEETRACFKAKLKSEPSPALAAALDEALNAALGYLERKKLYDYLYSRVFQLGLFGQVHRYLDEYRRQTDSLLLSDTNDLLQRIISEDETPFIYERMGTSIKHYLIDEFQDTSQMQWENLKPLVLESMSRGNDNLIIGDEKQCIYRFRNSDPNLLGSRVEKLVGGRFPGMLTLRGTGIDDNCNWRSSADVVRFNNSVFNSLARQLDGDAPGHPVSRTYAGLIQRIPDVHAGFRGYIKIMFPAPEKPDCADDGADAEASRDDDDMLRQMVAEIDRQLSAGYRPSDIAVLVRKKSQGKRVITYLMDTMANSPEWHHGVLPIVSADSMEIGMSAAVRMIVNVLRLATQPAMITHPGGEVGPDGKPLEVVNPAYRRHRLAHRFELCRFDEVDVTDGHGTVVTDESGKPLRRRLTDSEALAKAIAATSMPAGSACDPLQNQIDEEIKRLSEMESPTVLAMTERIIERFLTPDARRRENVFITAFQDMVLDYTDHGETNLNSFLQWWDRVGVSQNVAAPDGIEALNVLTIHKAKGLEYECVHIPYCSDSMVKYHSRMVKSLSWYAIDPDALPGVDADCVPPFMPLPNRAANKEIPALRAEAEAWETEQKTDALNVAYVAFTRAVSELCVYVDKLALDSAGKPGRREGAPALGDYLLMALRDMTPDFLPRCGVEEKALQWMVPLSPCLTEDESGRIVFSMGEPTVPRSGGKVVPGGDNPGAGTDGVVPDAIPEEYSVNGRSEICACMDFEDLASFTLADDRHRGIFLHGVLGRVNHRRDLDAALAAEAYRYRLTDSERQECRALLEKVLAEPRVEPWFEGFSRVLTERSLSGPQTLRRPDRVVWLADGTPVVVDYKFGAENRRIYREQVRDYMTLLAEAGHPGARGYLWFPLKGEIIEV